MKKTYKKPQLNKTKIIAIESIICTSNNISINIDHEGGYQALSNEESQTDIWGNTRNDIWQ